MGTRVRLGLVLLLPLFVLAAGNPVIGRATPNTPAGRPGREFSYCSRDAPHGPAWHLTTVDHIGGSGGNSTSLALDSAGWPHISYYYYDTSDHSNIKYAYFDGAAWHIETVDTGSASSLVLDDADRPHISYESGGDIRYAYFDGITWITTTAVERDDVWSAYGSPSLALDSAGLPHISYMYWSKYTDNLRYAYYDGAAWQREIVDSQLGGDFSSLALDASDRPHISYRSGYGGEHVRYAHNDGNSWQIQTVDNNGYAGVDTSLALDSAGRPHISYGVDYPSYELRYAHYDGTSWTIEVVDSAWYVPFYDTSLALDGNGRPHIGYEYLADHDLKYAYFDGVAWRTQVVDSSGDVGQGTSLALDATREPHISYYDSTNGDLKYAYHTCAALDGADIEGPARLPLGITSLYTATYQPITATYPLVEWNNGTLDPRAFYSWTVTGTHVVAITATNDCSQVRGTFTVTVFCQEVAGLAVAGPHALLVGQTGLYLASPLPITASRPLTFTWDNGASTPTTTYSWATTGTYTLTVTATNVCESASAASLQIRVLLEWPHSVYLPLAVRNGQRNRALIR